MAVDYNFDVMSMTVEQRAIVKKIFDSDFSLFASYFFKVLTGETMLMNWHHKWLCKVLEQVYNQELKNVIINISPGASKSVMLCRLFPAYCYSKKPHCRFLEISYDAELVESHSVAVKDIIGSKEFRALYGNYSFKSDNDKKAEWTLSYGNQVNAGEFVAVSLKGGITGKRGGYMEEGFTGCIIIDDPVKVMDAASKAKRDEANAVLSSTVSNRRALEDKTPILMIMQRLNEDDPTGYLLSVHADENWTHISIPALIDREAYDAFPEDVKQFAREYIYDEIEKTGSASYWEYKVPKKKLLEYKEKITYEFQAQYQQNPVPKGGALFQTDWFQVYQSIPEKFDSIKIFADTAVSAKTYSDSSVLLAVGEVNKNLYLLDLLKGKWEMPELTRNAINFVTAIKTQFSNSIFKGFFIEFRSSGQGLVQTLRNDTRLPIIDICPKGEKVQRAQQALPYVQGKRIYIPEKSQWVANFLLEVSQFSPAMSHKHDDQVDVLVYAIWNAYIEPRTVVVRDIHF